EDSGRLLREVTWILLVGIALGLGFNQVLRASGSSRALPWVSKERPALAKLEDAAPAQATPASSGSAADAATPPPAAAKPARVAPAPAPQHSAAAPRTARATRDTSRTRPDTSAAKLPVIPDAREPREAGYATIKLLHDAKAALFVDARSAEEYAEAHIPGAVNLPFDDVFKQPDLVKSIDAGGRPIVCYCGGGDCE